MTPLQTLSLPPACAVANDPADPLARRVHVEPPHAYRTPFQRDRGRIIHARSFRRLAGKTQVFTHRFSDHFRSRLTHTIEVAQISRTIATALGLNEDLAEALALVHDIGHPPFGHAGERALDEAMREHGLHFDHNLHALRIIEHFEQRYAAFRGLNLTLGVREGIVKHSRDYSLADHPELAAYFLESRPPLEAQIIDLGDEIAYLTADIDDGLESGILSIEQLRANVTLLEQFYRPMEQQYAGAPPKLVFNEALKRMLNALVGDLIRETRRRAESEGITTLQGIRQSSQRLAAFSTGMEEQRRQAKAYLYAHLYEGSELSRDHLEADRVIRSLYTQWVNDPSLLPASYAAQVEEEGAPRTVADYIAGMTDGFILAQFARTTGQLPPD